MLEAPGAVGSAGVIVGEGPGGVGGGSGVPPPLHSRQSSAWWDGVSHIVTRPAREHVT